MGQSRISTHLAQLKRAGFVEDRRIGKSILYRFVSTAHREFGPPATSPSRRGHRDSRVSR